MRCSWFVSVTGLKQHFAEVVYFVNRSILTPFLSSFLFQVDVAAAANANANKPISVVLSDIFNWLCFTGTRFAAV